MKIFHEQGVDPDRIRHHHEMLPDVWKKTKGRFWDRLRYTLAKTWESDQLILAFSSWIAGRLSYACAIEYEKPSQSCKVTVNSELSHGWRGNAEEKFVDALRIVLAPSE